MELVTIYQGPRADANNDPDGWCMLANHSNDQDEIRNAFGDLALAQWCLIKLGLGFIVLCT